MEKIARGRGREANIARGERQCFNWFIVLAGLFRTNCEGASWGH